jgi:GNAT superfamily N-acetyltransferase
MTVPAAKTRQAEPVDAPVLAAMIRELARYEGSDDGLNFSIDQLKSALAGDPPRLRAIIAEDVGGMKGFVTYTIDFAIWTGADVLRVDDVFVCDSVRRKGIGRLLMTGIAELATKRGITARWEIEPDNLSAQRFYEGLGVKIRGKIVARWSLDEMHKLLELVAPRLPLSLSPVPNKRHGKPSFDGH